MKVSNDIAKDGDGQDAEDCKRDPEANVSEEPSQQQAETGQPEDKSSAADVQEDDPLVLLQFAKFWVLRHLRGVSGVSVASPCRRGAAVSTGERHADEP